MRSPPRRTSSAGNPRLAVGIDPAVPAKKTERSIPPSLSADGDQLEPHAAAGDGRDPHRVPRRPPALGRAAGVEDLESVSVLLVQRNVGMAEHDRIRIRKPAAKPRQPALG